MDGVITGGAPAPAPVVQAAEEAAEQRRAGKQRVGVEGAVTPTGVRQFAINDSLSVSIQLFGTRSDNPVDQKYTVRIGADGEVSSEMNYAEIVGYVAGKASFTGEVGVTAEALLGCFTEAIDSGAGASSSVLSAVRESSDLSPSPLRVWG